jgi:hypothetical protein
MAYALVTELADTIQLDNHATETDNLQRWLDAAEMSIDRFCNRAEDGFVAIAVATARYYHGKGEPHLLIDECIEITEVAVKDSATETTYTAWSTPTTMMAGDGDWIPYAGVPSRPYFGRLPYTALMTDPNGTYCVFTSGTFAHRGGFRPSSTTWRNVPTVKVTAKWGYATVVPAVIKQACIFQAARWYKRGSAGGADAMASGEMGTLLYVKALDPAIQMLLVESRMVRPLYGN